MCISSCERSLAVGYCVIFGVVKPAPKTVGWRASAALVGKHRFPVFISIVEMKRCLVHFAVVNCLVANASPIEAGFLELPLLQASL